MRTDPLLCNLRRMGCATAVAALAGLLAPAGAAAQTPSWPADLWPVLPLPKLSPEDLTSISAGWRHVCATRRDGRVYCWGYGDLGQLGLSTLSRCSTFDCAMQPTRVAVDVNGKPFLSTRLSAGSDHTCALDAAGAAYCWGTNGDGQTGVPGLGQVWQPTPVAVGLNFTAIGAGSRSSCAVEPNSMWCWGLIGDGRMNGPAWWPMAVPSSANYQAVTVGFAYACMQSNVPGYEDVNCIGRNQFGELGFDPALGDALPVPFGSDFGRPVGPPRTGGLNTCADHYADGTVWCAGQNAYGQLGNGNNKPSGVPQPVGGGAKLAGVAVGFSHACAIDPQQQAWCWGSNYFGQLGNGSRVSSWVPVLVGGGAVKFRTLAAGTDFTCGIGTDNQIYCWGSNSRAQLGRGYVGSYDWVPRRPSVIRE